MPISPYTNELLKEYIDDGFESMYKYMDIKFTAIDRKFIEIDKRIGSLEQRIGSLEEAVLSLGQKLEVLPSFIANVVLIHLDEKFDELKSDLKKS